MPKKSITKLYAEFEKALANADRVYMETRGEDDETFAAAVDIASKLCWRIVEAPADPKNPIPDLLLKIAAAGWSAGALPPFDRWVGRRGMGGGDELACLESIRADLEAMQAAPPRRARRTDTRRRVGDQVVRS
jgi:hypothetical protein